MPSAPPEKRPAQALIEALQGRTVIDAKCDAEGADDVRLRLDNGTVILVDTELDADSVQLAESLGRPPWPRLLVRVGGDELWPRL